MAVILSSVVIWFGIFIVVCDGQSSSVANNIYDSLQPLGCSQFLAILNKCSQQMRDRYSIENFWTVFAPNDTAFARLPPDRRNAFLTMTQAESENYILAFTLPKVLETIAFNELQPEQSRSPLNTRIFFKKRRRRDGNSASGVAGPTEYYANGAMILRPNIPAGNSYIHVIDRVLDIPSGKSVLGYISLGNQSDTSFYREILAYITGEEDYPKTVDVMNTRPRITVFVPTREAIGRIPKEKLDLLRGNPSKLNEVAQMHIIEHQVVYTSFVYHNEGINNLGKGQIIFRTNTAREAVFVSSGGVTAQVVSGNITCRNGAIHFIDTLLGYKYNTAKDEIWLNPITQTFKQVLERSRNELQNAVVAPSGVTIFVPTDAAFLNVPSYNNIMTNISLINKMIELSMLEPGLEIELTGVNGAYEARLSLTSQYFRNPIQVYRKGNETWIESGYVKARVVRQDVGVTNGYVHIIDAVPGVPSRDIPNTIFCEDWLIKSSLQLAVTGLNDFMRDVRLNSIAPCTTSSGVQSASNVYTAFVNQSYPVNDQQGSSQGNNTQGRPCGSNCFFTVFIPNGTAIDNFENMIAGKQIQADNGRWQNVLMRHITRQRIYLDQKAIGVEHTFTALNGDQVRYRRATTRYAYLYYKGRQSRVIHSDLGGTNGVIHIIDAVIFTSDDSSSPSMDTHPDQLTCPSEWKDGKSEVLNCTIQVSGYTNRTCKQFSDLVDLQFTPRSSESPSSICTVRNLTQSCDGQYSSKGCRCKEESQGAYLLEFVVEARKQFQEGGTWRCVPAWVDEVLRNRYLHPPYAERLQCGPVSFDDLKPTPTTDTGKSVTTTDSSNQSGINASHQTLGITSSKFGLYLSALVAIVVYVHT